MIALAVFPRRFDVALEPISVRYYCAALDPRLIFRCLVGRRLDEAPDLHRVSQAKRDLITKDAPEDCEAKGGRGRDVLVVVHFSHEAVLPDRKQPSKRLVADDGSGATG